MRQAALELDPKYKPTFTFVICGKRVRTVSPAQSRAELTSARHHMRFFAANEQDNDRSGNLPPGLRTELPKCRKLIQQGPSWIRGSLIPMPSTYIFRRTLFCRVLRSRLTSESQVADDKRR